MRIYPRHEAVAQHARDVAIVVAIVESVGERIVEAGTRRVRNTAADAKVLRMIPVCSEGVGGTVPGTDPYQAYIECERRAERASRRTVL